MGMDFLCRTVKFSKIQSSCQHKPTCLEQFICKNRGDSLETKGGGRGFINHGRIDSGPEEPPVCECDPLAGGDLPLTPFLRLSRERRANRSEGTERHPSFEGCLSA
jgi:hypothetical protein